MDRTTLHVGVICHQLDSTCHGQYYYTTLFAIQAATHNIKKKQYTANNKDEKSNNNMYTKIETPSVTLPKTEDGTKY